VAAVKPRALDVVYDRRPQPGSALSEGMGARPYARRGAVLKGSHFSEVATERETSCQRPTEPSLQIMPLAALGVGFVLVKAIRNKNVRRQRIVILPHFLDACVHFVHSVAECREGIL
jgi:hypothetical protein